MKYSKLLLCVPCVFSAISWARFMEVNVKPLKFYFWTFVIIKFSTALIYRKVGSLVFKLSFFSDQQEITPSRRQTNTTELDNAKTWLAVSVLELTISKENHGRMLSCVAVHESYSTKSSSIEVRMDVMCKYF